jgi:thioredoxin reductase (NADPH)
VHYWASPLETKLCAGQEVVLVGAGNSAGQAVVYLANQVAKVWLLVRGADLNANMSSYLYRGGSEHGLARRIRRGACDPKGFVLTGAEVGSNRRLLETSCPGVFAIGDVRSGSRQYFNVGESGDAVDQDIRFAGGGPV